jgi:hypothetical protein
MGFHAPVELLGSWTSGEPAGPPKSVFLPNDPVEYVVNIANNTDSSESATVRWTQSGACGEITVAEQTLVFVPGVTKLTYPATILTWKITSSRS